MKPTHYLPMAKFLKHGLVLISVLFSLNTAATQLPSIQFSESFEVIAFNGKPHASGLFNEDQLLVLNKGLNRLVLVFEVVIDGEDNDQFDIVKSVPFLMEIYLDGAGQYMQRYLKPNHLSQARRFAQNPMFDIVNTQTNIKQPFTLKPLPNGKIDYYVSQTRLPKRTPLVIGKSSQGDKFSASANKSTKAKQALEKLRYWWQKASNEERQIFLNEVSQ